MKLLKWLFGPSKRTRQLQAELVEARRQEVRAWLAYALIADVVDNYGPEYFDLLTDFETIITDNKPITIINYLNI
jgi:Mg2+ and Co2+ transporter CorA